MRVDGALPDETNILGCAPAAPLVLPIKTSARGYGLFAANPLGQKVFSNGKENLNLTLKNGESTTFRYRTVIASESLSDEKINQITADFGKVK